MTQAWAIMLLGRRLPEIDHWDAVADLYLVPAMDLPWQEDGTCLFGSELARAQFMEVAVGELDRRRLPWVWVEGEGEARAENRSEEHTSELQSLMRISYDVFCLKKKKQ